MPQRKIQTGGWDNGVYYAEHRAFSDRFPCDADHGMSLADSRLLVEKYLPGYEVKRGRTNSGRAFCSYKRKVISLPRFCPQWLVLHEIAHGLVELSNHGPVYREAYAKLVGLVMGYEWEIRLRAEFKKVGYR